MSKKLRLSHSQINTYSDCQFKWYLDKVKRLRPNWLGSALLFGSALDESVEHILLKKKGCYLDAFTNSLRKFQVNGEQKLLPDDILSVRFFNGDLDVKIVTSYFNDEYPEVLGMYCETLGIEVPNIGEFYEYYKQQRRNKDPLSKEEQSLFNFLAWNTMEAKGIMILKKLEEWIGDNVLEVHNVQKKIEIGNDNGDKFIGYLDFIVTLKTDCETCGGDGLIDTGAIDEGGYPIYTDCPSCNPKKVLIDLKTSSNPKAYYPPESASESMQLGIYSQEEGIPDVAYLVADKKIRVREPRVRLSFVEGVITEEHLDQVFDEIEHYTTEIKEKIDKGKKAFKKNKESCVKFGGCQYFNYCKNKDMKGLCYVKKT